jgi:alpha-galactosidase
MSLWALLAASLLAGNDIRNMTDATKEILMNKEVIAIDQDREGVQGVAVRKEGECSLAPPKRPAAQIACREVWRKQLANGVAVGLFNRSEESAKISVKWSEVGVNKKNAKVRDLWAHKDVEAPKRVQRRCAGARRRDADSALAGHFDRKSESKISGSGI